MDHTDTSNPLTLDNDSIDPFSDLPAPIASGKVNDADIENALRQVNEPLNPEQRLAAQTTEGPVMIVAGAGTGKTKAMIHRVASLMIKGVPAANIMIVTFTNQAAAEIKERLEGMIGENGQYVHAGTFHSIIFREMLQRYAGSKYLMDQGINMAECAILDDKESKSLIKDAIDSLPEEDKNQIAENEWKISDFDRIMSLEKAKGHDVFDFFAQVAPGTRNEEKYRILAAIWRAYNQKCRDVNGIDFDDILLHADKMLKKEPEVAEELSRQFKYIMLDEYQDTNGVQMSIMDSISSYHNNICTVGDEKQSIYKFRGADISVIMSFKNRYPNAVLIDMVKNYRSYSEIIQYSNAIADAMPQKLSDGQLDAQRAIEESPTELKQRKANSVTMVEFPNDRDEAKTIARAIIRDIKLGVPGENIAVLYRNRGLKDNLEKVLVDENIPYELIGDTSFFKKAEVKDAVSLVRFIFHPWDSVAGFRMLKATSMRVSDVAAKKAMSNQGINVHEFLLQESQKRLKSTKKGDELPELKGTAKKVKPFMEIIKMLRESVEFGDSPDYIRDVLAETWDIYMRPGLEKKDKDGKIDSKLENVNHVFKRVKESLETGMSISEIIEDLSMMVDSESEFSDDNSAKIKLMTMHASKGKEFDNVYIIGLDNITTHGQEPDPVEVEESRRLTYVGMTRAEKKLVMSYSTQRMHNGEFIQTSGSEFIDEIEERLNVRRMIIGRSPSPVSSPAMS
jgi:DNA helicase-2/ATP-dependent DNA helicase PcrA